MTERGHGSHLGDIVAALVDGELGVDARDRALSHAAGCSRCKADVDAQRQLKATLRGTTVETVSAEFFLLASLLEIPQSPLAIDPEPRLGARSLPFVRSHFSGDRGTRLAAPLGDQGWNSRRRYVVGAGCAASVMLGFVGVASLGAGGAESGVNGRLVSPAVSTYTVENAATIGEVPLTDANLQAAVTVAFRGR